MELKEQKKKAKEFAEYWKDKGYEKGDSQPFWLSLLRDVYGVDKPEQYISFEDQVHLDNTAFIDGYIDKTHIMIEQKSIDKDLRKSIKQSDGSFLTPFQQAKRYASELPYSKRPRWIITSNFKEFFIYDMEKPNGAPSIILLENLPKEFYRLNILVDEKDKRIEKEMEMSFQAGELAGALYDAFVKQYSNIENDIHEQKSLNKLIVRIVFCLYAEDSGIFGKKNMFHNYLSKYEARDMRKALIDLFIMLDKKYEDRDKYEDSDLLEFPYVNGGLFAEENIIVPQITEEIKELLLTRASDNFDWSGISPTIFGAIFESTLNPETRRSGGMHYTSIENIHKIIDPLFLDELKEELEEIKKYKDIRTIIKKVKDYQEKLSSLKFLDPACGSGNFLTETYISLRRLENEAIKLEQMGQITIFDPIKVRIGQFLGIEINDFAVTVAKTALWIAESQMMKETEELFNLNLEFLPLKTNAGIIEGNALTINWETLFEGDEINYIMGNPPFVGQALKSNEQSREVVLIFGKGSPETKQDYVVCWYKKALDFMKTRENKIMCAFVSTSSICQGESVPTFWRRMIDEGALIQFAYRSFAWESEATEKASVYCVIVGFSDKEINYQKRIYDNGAVIKVKSINAYLLDGPNIWLKSRVNKSKDGRIRMTKGSEPADGGNLLLSIDQKEHLEIEYPILEKYIKPFIGGREFLDNPVQKYTRYCLWFKDGNPHDFSNINEIKKRLTNIREMRENSKADRIRKTAEYPYLFCQIRQPDKEYLVFPQHSTSSRKYIPIAFEKPDVIVGNACQIVPEASLYDFGILTSNVHMLWVKIVCGRLGEAYRYEPSVLNNFPLPNVNLVEKNEIERTAQAILDARALYPESSLSELYDELIMPTELREAHNKNDNAVMKAYKLYREVDEKKIWLSESEEILELFKLYEKNNKTN